MKNVPKNISMRILDYHVNMDTIVSNVHPKYHVAVMKFIHGVIHVTNFYALDIVPKISLEEGIFVQHVLSEIIRRSKNNYIKCRWNKNIHLLKRLKQNVHRRQ